MRGLIGRFRNKGRAAGRRLRAFGRREDGSIAIEYVVLGPIYMTLLLGIFELAAVSMSMTSMRVGLDDLSRQVRTGQGQCLSNAEVKAIVCDATLGSGCDDGLQVERSTYSAGAGVDAVTADAWDELNPDDIVLLSASYDWTLVNPLLNPFLGNGEGAVEIAGAVVFKNESFSNASCN